MISSYSFSLVSPPPQWSKVLGAIIFYICIYSTVEATLWYVFQRRHSVAMQGLLSPTREPIQTERGRAHTVLLRVGLVIQFGHLGSKRFTITGTVHGNAQRHPILAC